MTVHPYGNSMLSSTAAQATALKESQLQDEVDIALLTDALEIQEELITGLQKMFP